MKMNVDMDQVKKQVVSKPLAPNSSRNAADLALSAYSPTASFINYPSPFGKHLNYVEQASIRLNIEENDNLSTVSEAKQITEASGVFTEVEQRRTNNLANEFMPTNT